MLSRLFLIIDIYFLISVVIAQTFIHTEELIITKETPNNEANAEIETQPLTAETKTRKCSKQFKVPHTFYDFYSLNHYVLIHLKDKLIYLF